jgi:hypothetical protein
MSVKSGSSLNSILSILPMLNAQYAKHKYRLVVKVHLCRRLQHQPATAEQHDSTVEEFLRQPMITPGFITQPIDTWQHYLCLLLFSGAGELVSDGCTCMDPDKAHMAVVHKILCCSVSKVDCPDTTTLTELTVVPQ